MDRYGPTKKCLASESPCVKATVRHVRHHLKNMRGQNPTWVKRTEKNSFSKWRQIP